MTKKEMKKRTCCFTGHRKIPQNEIVKVKTQLRRTVETAIKIGRSGIYSRLRKNKKSCRGERRI